jgi:hypothetical protein
MPLSPLQLEAPGNPASPLATAVVVLACALIGCEAPPRGGDGQAHATATTSSARPTTTNAIGEQAAADTGARVRGDAWRLPQDVHRAARALEWGVIHYDIEPDQPRYEPVKWRGSVTLVALTPDGRKATVLAEPAGDGQVAVRVSVGLFGDAFEQERFVRSLRRMLASDPKPVRGWGFELPKESSGDPGGAQSSQ